MTRAGHIATDGINKSIGAGLEALRVERIDDLIGAEERAEMNDDLARLADQRRRVEAESRCLPMA